MSTPTVATGGGGQLPTALVYGLSALIVAAVVIATAALGLGVRTTYGAGIDPSLGSQVQHDFLTDQQAEATALSNADAGSLNGRLTEGALQDVSQQISDQKAAGPAPAVSFQPGSLSILRAQDPNDSSLVIEVQEDGTKNVTTAAGPNAAPSLQAISFHGDYWLRKGSSGRYLIADQKLQNQPSSILPALALVVVAVAWIAIAAALLVRRRRLPAQAPADLGLAAAVTAVAAVPAVYEQPEPVAAPPPEVLIRTFGGFQVLQGGTEWSAALKARPVTGFIWLRLLVAAIRDPNARPSRDELGREASPNLDRETQLKRMRNVIHQGLRELPAPLSERIRVEPQVLSFNVANCEIDAIDLLKVAAECAGRNQLSPFQIARAHRAIEASTGVFLPEFETLEDIATYSHPTCADLLREQRELLSAKRLELILVLAQSYSATGRPAEAIALLEPAFQHQPTRGDLRSHLAAAYASAGRDAEASALEVKA